MAAHPSKIDWPKRYELLAEKSTHPVIKSFYQSAVSNASLPISEVPLVALDFETTGLNFDKDDIVSVGLVPFTSKRIYCKDSAHWLVQPQQKLDEESIVVHGITHSELKHAPDFSSIMEPVLKALTGKVIVVHFSPIERHFLYQAMMSRVNEGVEFAVIDTLELERRALKAKQGLLGRLFNSKLGSVRLADSRTRYSLPAYQNHNALNDAIATAELLQAQLAYHYRPDTELSQLWF
ncbi:3'-5' exonuclease [Pseudoalteromonas sp. N1230-9]|uniref:3'-5' exonuclease n=1 Tax=Pseudoalteromonas sp. N1230-9 TaxID=2907156 RepID=UPI002B2EBD4D|nr:3'-5' exonuclease [Pseudoalteromonas sp. N1230-9]